MIRGVILHMQGEQPLRADIEALPTPSDACLVCTNLTDLSGKRPSFIDHTDSWFLIPLLHIRFVEIPSGAVARDGAEPEPERGVVAVPDTDELELDEDFLRRIKEA